MASVLLQRFYMYIYICIYTHTHIYSYSHTLILFGLIQGNSVISSIESVSDDSIRSQEKKKKVSRKEVDTPSKQCHGKIFEQGGHWWTVIFVSNLKIH